MVLMTDPRGHDARRRDVSSGRSRGRRAAIVLSILAGCLGLAACGSSGSSGGSTASSGSGSKSSSKSPYIVGLMDAFSGPLAITGVGAEEALKVFTSQTGGKLGGHPLEVVPINDQSIGADAIPALRAYLAHHPKPTALIVANSVSAVAIAPTTAALKIPVFVVGEDSTLQKYSNVEQIQPPQATFAAFAAQWMKAKGISTFGLMAPAAPNFTLLANDFKASAKTSGITMTVSEFPSFTATDYQSEAQEIAAKNPQAVVVEVFGTGFLTAVRELREDGYKGLIIFQDTSLTPQAPSLPALQGSVDIGWHADPVWGPLAKSFYDYYQVHFHATPGIEVDDYEAVYELNAVIPKLLAEGKSVTSDNVMPAIIAHGAFPALQGSSLTVNSDHDSIIPVNVWSLKDSKFTRLSGTS
jgi:ABC-type branched-subunit amino acid transport system substrate-binding protein